MFTKILMPVDLSSDHQQVIDIVAEIAHQGQGEVTLFHVIELIPDMPLEEERHFYGQIESRARDHLAHLGQRFDAYQVPWRLEVVYGKRAPTILQHARETSTELIVLTADRIVPSTDTGVGAVSYPVSFFTHCPVLLLKRSSGARP
jgi:nucleotide-binding universal stress UspA family protein